MPLEQALPEMETVAEDYRARLYRRGAVAPKKGGQVITPEIVADEERRGFKTRGTYLERLSCFTRGLILGGREAVADWIAVLKSQDRLSQRRRPVDQGRRRCLHPPPLPANPRQSQLISDRFYPQISVQLLLMQAKCA